jgi:hypothetical protein
VATPSDIGEWLEAHTRAVMNDDLAPLERASALPFRTHLSTIVAALPMPLRSVDVKHVWRSGGEWHVEAEVVGDEGVRTLLLRYLDTDRPQILGGAVRTLN